jgi:hypothetical protein
MKNDVWNKGRITNEQLAVILTGNDICRIQVRRPAFFLFAIGFTPQKRRAIFARLLVALQSEKGVWHTQLLSVFSPSPIPAGRYGATLALLTPHS